MKWLRDCQMALSTARAYRNFSGAWCDLYQYQSATHAMECYTMGLVAPGYPTWVVCHGRGLNAVITFRSVPCNKWLCDCCTLCQVIKRPGDKAHSALVLWHTALYSTVLWHTALYSPTIVCSDQYFSTLPSLNHFRKSGPILSLVQYEAYTPYCWHFVRTIMLTTSSFWHA